MLPGSHSARNCGTTAVAENHVVIESASTAASRASALREARSTRAPFRPGRPPLLVHDRRPEAGERLVLPHLDHLDLGSDLVTRPHRRLEAPVDMQEHASGARQILRHDRVKRPDVTPPWTIRPTEARPGRRLLVVVKGIRSPVSSVKSSMSRSVTRRLRRATSPSSANDVLELTCERRGAVRSAAITRHVSSPASVPTISGCSIRSRARAIAGAEPSSDWTTTRFSAGTARSDATALPRGPHAGRCGARPEARRSAAARAGRASSRGRAPEYPGTPWPASRGSLRPPAQREDRAASRSVGGRRD